MLKINSILWIPVLLAFLVIELPEALSYNPGDFPNYFEELIQMSTVHKSGEKKTSFKNEDTHFSEKDTTRAENLVEQALFSILRRLQVPYVEGKNGDGTPRIATNHFFEKIEAIAEKEDPKAKVYIAGGVVRSLLGYIYKEIYDGHQKIPPETTEKVLKDIIDGKKKTGKDKEIFSLAALGVGSDLDILLEPSENGKVHAQLIKSKIFDFINSAETAAGLREDKTKFKYAVVPIGDVKIYSDQIKRTTSQGGSTMDWFALPLTEKSGRHMRMPEGHPNILKKFLLGEYDYLPPSDPRQLIDPDKQTLRGLRSYLEIPYLHFSKQNGQEQVKSELRSLIKKVKSGKDLSPGAQEQLKKMVYNARFGGANNRFAGSKDPGSQGQEIEDLVHQLSEALKKDEKNLPAIPEFIVNKDPQRRGGGDKCKLNSTGLLMKQNLFFDHYTHQGRLYHGTHDFDAIFAIIRNGFIRSSIRQGRAAAGSGAYATKDKSLAQGYGTAIELQLKNRNPLRILDWNKVSQTEEIQAIVNEAKKVKQDPFQYLAENCDIDFIVINDDIVLIQNSGAIQLPKDIAQIIQLYENTIPDLDTVKLSPELAGTTLHDIFKTIHAYEGFYSIGTAMGLNLKKNHSLVDSVTKFLENPNPIIRKRAAMVFLTIDPNPQFLKSIPNLKAALLEALDGKKELDKWALYAAENLLMRLKPTDLEFQQALVRNLEDSDSDVRRTAGIALGEIKPEDPVILESILALLRHADPKVRSSALEALGQINPVNPAIQQVIVRSLDDPNPDVCNRAALTFLTIKPIDPIALNALVKALNHWEWRVRSAVIEVLAKVKPTDLAFQQAIALRLKDPVDMVRYSAITALGNMKVTDPTILEALARGLLDSDAGIRVKVAQAIESNHSENKSEIQKCIGNAVWDQPLDPRQVEKLIEIMRSLTPSPSQ